MAEMKFFDKSRSCSLERPWKAFSEISLILFFARSLKNKIINEVNHTNRMMILNSTETCNCNEPCNKWGVYKIGKISPLVDFGQF